MYTKCMRGLHEKIHCKVKSISRSEEDFYYDEYDEDSVKRTKKTLCPFFLPAKISTFM